MRKLFVLWAISMLWSFSGGAQDNSHLRISLLTVGAGHQEIYEPFGHTGVRIIDSLYGTDIVYNYGTFTASQESIVFAMQFMQGKLPYSLSTAPYNEFVAEYVYAKRKVQEQVLIMDAVKKQEIQAYLFNNLRPENRFYKYDFFFDNCATRIRDIFTRTFGPQFVFARVIPPAAKITYRDIIHRYLYREHLYRFGIDILLGSKIDAVMSNEDIMFLPDYLRDGLAGAQLGTAPVSTAPVVLLDGDPQPPAGINQGLVLTLIFLVLTAAGIFVKPLHPLGRVMVKVVMTINTFLGILILVMWFGTDHEACRNNWNFLWALPTGVLLLGRYKGKSKYAFLASMLIIVSLALHLTGIQALPIVELMPWLLTLLLAYGTIYKRKFMPS